MKIGSALIHCFAQRFAGLEVGHVLFWNRHTFAVAWIASNARGPVVDRETAKAPNFDSVPVHQCIVDGVKNRPDGKFGITLGKLPELGRQFFDQVGARHG